VREVLDAWVLDFPKGRPPTFVKYPAHLTESEARERARGGTGAVSGPGSVLAEPDQAEIVSSTEVIRRAAAGGAGRESPAPQDVGQSGRCLKYVFCESCGWRYGSWWLKGDVGYWGDCPHCGARTRLLDREPEVRESRLDVREPRVAAQQELGF
jgi:hypothetical protein